MDEIVQLISNVGFPIACCLIMFFYVSKSVEYHKEEISNLTKEYKAEISELSTAINNNTSVMQSLISTLTIK